MLTITRAGLPRPDAVLLRLRLIGRMEALTLGNESVLPLGRKTRGLLAILALGGRKPVLRLRLAELLWSRRSEEQARASLRQEIHRLGEALSPVGTDVITVDRHTLALKPSLTSVDAERILTARPGQVDSLPPIEGVLLEELNGTDPALDGWLAAERIRLRDHAVDLFEEMLSRQRDPEGILNASRQLLALDGQHERAWLATLQTHLATGNVALARQLGERCLTALEPGGIAASGPELRDALHTLRLDADQDATPYALAGSEAPPPTGAEAATPPQPDQDPGPPVRLEWPDAKYPSVEPIATAAPLSGDQPSIAIVPVMVLDPSGDPETSHFASSLVHALQAGLAGNSWARVLSGSALQDSLSQGRDDAVLRRRFGARYVVDGTLLRLGGVVRVILRLSSIGRAGQNTSQTASQTASQNAGQLLWAQRFDGRADDLLTLQDSVAAHVTARLPAEIIAAEAVQSRRVAEHELEPHPLAALALQRLNDGDRADTEAAVQMLDRALAKAPDSPYLHAALATAHLMSGLQRWADPEDRACRAEAAARAALAQDPSDPLAMAGCAHVLSELRNRPDAAMALVERALSLNPYAAEAWAVGAYPLIRLGRLDEAARFFATYKDLFATHPLAALLDPAEVMIPLLRGDADTAARRGLLQSELRPAAMPVLVPYLAALGHLRQTGEAERIRNRMLLAWPDSGVDALVARAGLVEPSQAEMLRSGLVLAGLGAAGLAAPGLGAAGLDPAGLRDDIAVDGAQQSDPHPEAPPPASRQAGGTGSGRSRRSRRPLGAEPLAG